MLQEGMSHSKVKEKRPYGQGQMRAKISFFFFCFGRCKLSCDGLVVKTSKKQTLNLKGFRSSTRVPKQRTASRNVVLCLRHFPSPDVVVEPSLEPAVYQKITQTREKAKVNIFYFDHESTILNVKQRESS
jgi:hypothetical protein